MTNELEGKLFLVTGATEGIGKFAAQDLLSRGATVAIVGRNKEKTERVAAELQSKSGSDRLETYLGDMSLLSGMLRVAAAFKAKHDRLDVLINNAGAVFTTYDLTADGIERTFALNHLGYFVLTTELMDLLVNAKGARVVSTSSGAHRMGKLDLDKVVKRDGKAGLPAYGDSKLANILFTREIARRFGPKGVVANCVHPGWVNTGFALNNAKSVFAFAAAIFAPLFARTPAKGAETILWAATSPEAASLNGEYLHDKKIAPTSPLAQDDDLARRLWALSESLARPSSAASAAA
ncbi:MAG: SDR family oxidoreductase [Polyangiaceae bacterium]